MKLSKTKYCNAMQCKKMLWLIQNKPEVMDNVDNESVLDNGNLVHETARPLLGKYDLINYNEDYKVMINDTKKALEKENNIICEASFSYQDNFCSVDILKKKGNEYEIYEVKGSTKVKDVFLIDLSYQLYVLTKLGLKIKKCYIVTLNSFYVRKGKLELKKLFRLNNVTTEVFNMLNDVEKNISSINKYMENKEEPKDDISLFCNKPYVCPFFKYCTKDLPEKNVFDVFKLPFKNKIKLYQEGIYSFNDLLKADINNYYKVQIEHEIKKLDDYIDKDKIKDFLKKLTKPLYFLDFETFQKPIPMYDNTSPYEQIPFQYSLHYMINDKLEHKEFLAKSGVDPRRELAENLVKDIPLDVCTLAYNMKFEKGVIRKLANIYPDLHDHLMNIYDHIEDLMIPFKDRDYYNYLMQGSYSIKYVLPALFPYDESLNYHNLDLIHNGVEAMSSYADLENKDREEIEYIRERLLRYCELDTYAMVKIYEKLVEVVKEGVK